MKVLTLVLIISVVFFEEVTAETVGALPLNNVLELLSIVVKGTTLLPFNCDPDLNTSEVQYWMYDEKNPNGYLINSLENVTVSEIVHILLHGWNGHKDEEYIKVIRNAYLKTKTPSVITIDYSSYGTGRYTWVYCNLPAVASNIANFMCQMNQYSNLLNVHVVGHSLGAHLAGIAGYKVQQQCQLNIGRITGLDPAGPGYQGIATEERLDPSDANFVDIIHTNQAQFGYLGNQGHIDFYPNCGFFQPGCLAIFKNITLNIFQELKQKFIYCSHQRSCYLFAESILNNRFLANSIPDPTSCYENFDPTNLVHMGEYCRSPQKAQCYYIKTNETQAIDDAIVT